MRSLLDINIVSHLICDPRGRIAERIKNVGEARVCTSIIVASELRCGAAKKESPRLKAQVDAVLAALDTLPFGFPGDETYGSVRTQLELAGTPFGGNELLIAAHAMALDFTLVTDNTKVFSQVAGLRLENLAERLVTNQAIA